MSYGDEKSGLLYGVMWLGGEAVILQSCGEVREVGKVTPLLWQDCALWCDLAEDRMWQLDGWVNG